MSPRSLHTHVALLLCAGACTDGNPTGRAAAGDASTTSRVDAHAQGDAAADVELAPSDAGVEDATTDATPIDAPVRTWDETMPPSSEGLCDVPDIPPALPAVSRDERTCSDNESDRWPDCIPNACEAADFATACRERCEMTCERQAWFCSGSECQAHRAAGEERFCDSEEVMQRCAEDCGDDASCLNESCQDIRARACAKIECPPGQPHRCGEITCSNTCGGREDKAFDGVCDDGSPINAQDDVCPLGEDCSDCGARSACFPLGAECFSSTQCCGFEDGTAWCVDVGGEQPLGRCVPACAAAHNRCPEDFECLQLTDDGSATSQACFPACTHPE